MALDIDRLPPHRGPSSASRHGRLARSFALPVGCYLFAAALLTIHLGRHPAFAYNWEPYTARDAFAFWDRPSWGIFRITDGLMTDSGRSPLLTLPIWLSFRVGGTSFLTLRLPGALLTAGAAPLLWLLGRRLVDSVTATLAALLLAVSPVYVLYGRTATLVGPSLLPVLGTVYALLRVMETPRRGPWLLTLQALLLLDAYAYAPARLLWPLALALLASELLWRRACRRSLLLAFAVTAVVLPVALVAMDRDSGPARLGAIPSYYDVRGEQVFALSAQPADYRFYLRLTDAERQNDAVRGSRAALAWRLVTQNAGDCARLLLDRGTRPTLTDSWNARGRLYPTVLVPWFLLGLARAARRARRRVADRLLFGLFCGLGLALLPTSRVDVGRLSPALPLLCLLVADGFVATIGWIAGRVRARPAHRVGAGRGMAVGRRLAPLAAATLLIVAAARSTWADERLSLPPSREARIAATLADVWPVARERGGAVLLTGSPEPGEDDDFVAASIRLTLADRYRFADLGRGGPPAPAPRADRPPLYYRDVLGRLRTGAIPGLCDNLYLIGPDFRRAFLARAATLPCAAPLRYEMLPV